MSLGVSRIKYKSEKATTNPIIPIFVKVLTSSITLLLTCCVIIEPIIIIRIKTKVTALVNLVNVLIGVP
jgi:hypothetical protein